MATIRRFEDLESWQKARKLANAIYDLTEQPRFAHDFKLRDQIQGAAGSVMHNIAEGFDCGSNLEFIRFLKLARRSASEVQSELYLATEAKQLINAFIAYLRRHRSPPTLQRSNNQTM
jgi:four helix bundle protein